MRATQLGRPDSRTDAQREPPDAGGAGAPEGGGPRVRVNAAACLEAAWRWFAVLAAGLLLLAAALQAVQGQQSQAWRDARLEITLQELREGLESDLLLGFEVELVGSGRAQALLEDALARDASLLSAEVFDVAGVSLFNTDRGAIGERVPDAWLAAIARARPCAAPAQACTPWSVRAGGETVLGLALRGPLGDVEGHVSVSSAPAPQPAPFAPVWAGLAAAGVFTGLAWMGVWRALHAHRRADGGRALGRAGQRLAAAQQRLACILGRLARDEDGEEDGGEGEGWAP